VSDVYHNPKTGEVWVDGTTYPSESAYHSATDDTTRLGGPATGLLHGLSQGLTYGVGDKVLAGIDAASSPDKHYDTSLANIRGQAKKAEASLPPGAATAAELGGAALSPISKIGAGLKAGAAVLPALYAAGRSEGGPHQTADEMIKAAGTGPLVQKGLELAAGVPQLLPAIASRYPALADKMARVMTSMTPSEGLAQKRMALRTGTQGRYADDVVGMNLHSAPTAEGRFQASESAIKEMGPQFEAARGGQAAPVEDVKQALDTSKLDSGSKARSVLESYKKRLLPQESGLSSDYDKLVAQGISRQSAKQATGYDPDAAKLGSVPLDKVGQVNSQLRQDVQNAHDPASGFTAGEARDLHDAKDALFKVELEHVAPDSKDTYPDLLRKYAVANDASTNTGLAGERPTITGGQRGIGPMGAAMLTAKKTHPVARAVLSQWAKRNNAPNSTLSSVVTKMKGPVAMGVAQALGNDDSLQAAVEIHKAQGEGQDTREAINPGSE
jgi:hypothetical protein